MKPLALISVAVMFIYFVVSVVRPAAQSAVGLTVYYTAARLTLRGQANANLYDNDQLGDEVERDAGAGVRDVFTAAPPASVLIMLPVAWLPFAQARIGWIALNVIGLCAALWIIVNSSGARRFPWLAAGLVVMTMLAAPITENFRLGQVYVFLLVLHAVTWRALQRGDDRLAGITLGLTMGLKLSGWPIWLLLLYRHLWQPIKWGIATIGAVVGLSVALVGFDAWREFVLVQAPHIITWPAAPLTAYQTTTGFFQHLFRFDSTWNPNPIVHTPGLATALTLILTAAALWLTAKRARRASSAFVLALALTELLGPIAEDYHFALLVLPLCVMWVEVVGRRRPALAFVALVATALIVLPLDFENPALAQGWTALLAYPRLYGGWLVWGVLMSVETPTNHDAAAA